MYIEKHLKKIVFNAIHIALVDDILAARSGFFKMDDCKWTILFNVLFTGFTVLFLLLCCLGRLFAGLFVQFYPFATTNNSTAQQRAISLRWHEKCIRGYICVCVCLCMLSEHIHIFVYCRLYTICRLR